MVIKLGRFGNFLACTGFPDCKNTKPLEKDLENLEISKEKCDKCGAEMIIKHGRFGPFLSCSKYPECKNIKSIKKSVGVKCPQCNKGEIVEKNQKRDAPFMLAINILIVNLLFGKNQLIKNVRNVEV